MKYAFLCTLFPEQKMEEVAGKSKFNMQDAANALEWHIYEGLCENLEEEILLFNVMPIGSFPQYYKDAFVKRETFATERSEKNINIGFCNAKFIRKIRQKKNIYKELLKWCEVNQDEEKTLFVYTVAATFVEPIRKLKKNFPDLKVCAIVADLPNMSSLSAKKSLLQNWFISNQSKKAYDSLSAIDCFVLLTKQMADYMHISQPFCVVEGISTATEEFGISEVSSDNTKRIMYTGTLHKKFGVMNLVQAFMKIPGENYELVICGMGDSAEEIKTAAGKDPRIKFYGQMPRAEILPLQKKATVLVNPRQNNEEFTKYSFPSKTMEYLSSCIPVVAYKLDGIPDEYDEYLNYVENDTVQALTDKLTEICELPAESRTEMGVKGQKFVIENKNPRMQVLKMLEMIKNFELKE